LATKADKTTISRLVRVDWETVGRICARVVADELDPGRLDGLFNKDLDEVSRRKHHRCITLVTDHATRKVVWGASGKDTKILDGFFDELGGERSAAIEAVSMDMGPGVRQVGPSRRARSSGGDLLRPVPCGQSGASDMSGVQEPRPIEQPKQIAEYLRVRQRLDRRFARHYGAT
jgi:hypothetical protein